LTSQRTPRALHGARGKVILAPSQRSVSRREFNKLAAGAAAVGPFLLCSGRASASQKKLKVAKWQHFLPQFDAWFETTAKEWGRQHDTLVTIDEIPVEKVGPAAAAEIVAGKGHDVFIFPWPPAQYYQHTIDHGEIYRQVAAKYGAIPQIAHRSTFNPKNRQYFAFADFWAPSPLHFRQDYWAKAGLPLGPGHYGGLYSGGKHLRDEFGIPSGLAFTSTLEGNITLHTMLYAFRALLLDANGDALFNKNVFGVVALKYLQDLYRDSGTPLQLSWESGGSVRAMLSGKTSCAINAISLLRAAEKDDASTAGKIWLQAPLLGRNGMGVTALPHVTNCSVVWKFAENQEGAKQFLADWIDNSRTGYAKSLGCNFPTYPKTVPDLIVQLTKDPQAQPQGKYTVIKDALHWTPNLGAPGFATPAYMEVFNSFVIPKMVQSVLKGQSSPENAAAAAAAEIQRIADKWKQIQ
jgi:multiple sugar transport system substrate-binding protein